MDKEKVKQFIRNARTIPFSIYALVCLNFFMFIGFVCKDLTLLYMVGTLVIVIMTVTFIGKATGLWGIPDELISENVRERIQEINLDFRNFIKYLDAKELQSSTTNTLVTILLIIFVGTYINGTLEIFLIVNYFYCLIFLPKETEACMGLLKQQLQNVISKISAK